MLWYRTNPISLNDAEPKRPAENAIGSKRYRGKARLGHKPSAVNEHAEIGGDGPISRMLL